MYYLQSRYYDPAVGRFLSGDVFASTGQGIIGNNMYAYCLNNPILCSDPSGYASWGTNTVAICDGGTGRQNPFYWDDSSRPYSAKINKHVERNAARRILDDNFTAKYRDVLVINAPFMETSAFSFGIILMGSDVTYDDHGIATLNHEYGHYIQLSQIGVIDYTTYIVIPSLVGFWGPGSKEDYYSQPWEYLADLFGGVDRYWYAYTIDAHQNAMEYWENIRNK